MLEPLTLPSLLDVLLHGFERPPRHFDGERLLRRRRNDHLALTGRQLVLTCKGAKDRLLARLDACHHRLAHLNRIDVHLLLAKAPQPLISNHVSLPSQSGRHQAVARVSEASVNDRGLTRRDYGADRFRVQFSRLLARDRQSGSL